MARSFAHATIAGNLTRDPELRQTPNGKSVCKLGIAVNSGYKDASGQWVDRASFFDVVVWGAQGEATARYLTKGNMVVVEGRLEQRTWEAQDGSKRSAVELVANTIVWGGREPGAGDGGRSSYASTPSGDRAPAEDFKDIDFGDEDDIPF